MSACVCVFLFLVYYCYYFFFLYVASAEGVRRSAAEALTAQLVSSTKIESLENSNSTTAAIESENRNNYLVNYLPFIFYSLNSLNIHALSSQSRSTIDAREVTHSRLLSIEVRKNTFTRTRNALPFFFLTNSANFFHLLLPAPLPDLLPPLLLLFLVLLMFSADFGCTNTDWCFAVLLNRCHLKCIHLGFSRVSIRLYFSKHFIFFLWR